MYCYRHIYRLLSRLIDYNFDLLDYKFDLFEKLKCVLYGKLCNYTSVEVNVAIKIKFLYVIKIYQRNFKLLSSIMTEMAKDNLFILKVLICFSNYNCIIF